MDKTRPADDDQEALNKKQVLHMFAKRWKEISEEVGDHHDASEILKLAMRDEALKLSMQKAYCYGWLDSLNMVLRTTSTKDK